jgi:hypothetical protein
MNTSWGNEYTTKHRERKDHASDSSRFSAPPNLPTACYLVPQEGSGQLPIIEVSRKQREALVGERELGQKGRW